MNCGTKGSEAQPLDDHVTTRGPARITAITAIVFLSCIVFNNAHSQITPINIVQETEGQNIVKRVRFQICVNGPWYTCGCDCCESGDSTTDSFICNFVNLKSLCKQFTYTGSVIDNTSFNHIHEAWDYRIPDSGGSGCSTCDRIKTAKSPVPTLQLSRFHRFRDISDPSSFGPGVFSNYDVTLSIMRNGGANRVRLFDPRTYHPQLLDDGLNFRNNGDVKDGIYIESLTRKLKELRLTDGFSGTGNLVTDIYQSKGAAIQTRDGKRYLFDVIKLDVPGDSPIDGISTWRHSDIGSVGSNGSAYYGPNSSIDVQGSGSDIWGSADQFRFVYQQITGDFDIKTRVVSIDNTDPWAKAGVMVRQSLAPGSVHAMAAATAANGFAFQRRTAENQSSINNSGWGTYFPGCWVRVCRQGTTVRAYRGANDDEVMAEWIKMGEVELPSTDPVLVGLCVTSHNNDALCKAQFRDASLTGTGAGSTWLSADIGISPAGSDTAVGNDGFDIQGSGKDIWDSADGFRYVFKNCTGDFDVKTRVASVQNTHSWAKAGVMVRQSTAANSIHALAAVSAGSGFAFQRRTTTGGGSDITGGGDTAYPNSWVRLNRQGATVHAYKATDETGSNWTEMGSIDLATADPVLIGLCVSAHDASALCLSEFRNVALSGSGISGDWQSLDIGTGKTGSTTEIGTTNAFTIRASGADIWNQNDAGHYTYQALRGDGALTARISNLSRTDSWAKAGVMFRESLADNSKFAYMLLSSDNGLAFQRRTATGASAVHTAGPGGTTPQWVRLVRSGNTISGYCSTDGQTWTFVEQDTVEMGTDIFVGLAATSHNDGYLSRSIYDNVVLAGTPTPANEWPPMGLSNRLGGRLTRMEDRNGYGFSLTYKYNAINFPGTDTDQQAAIAESPDRQWQINTVTDSTGRQLQYSYYPQPVSGRWAVSSILLPNGQSTQYQYSNGFLSQVNLPDGTVSTFTAEYEPNSECTVITYSDAAAEGTHRRKRAYLTNNFSVLVSKITNTSSIWNNASLLVRMVVNGDGEVSYLNLPHPTMSWVFKIYEGAGRVKVNSDFNQTRYLKDGWTYNPGQDFDTFSGELEETYVHDVESGDYYEVRQRRRVPETVDEYGVVRQYSYHDNDLIWKVNYTDGTYEEYNYDHPLQLLTRYKDRQNRVAKYTYDARGNMLTKEIGILFINGSDINQPEHAFYQWEYFPEGDPNQYLLKTAKDALYSELQPDMHRTDYEYEYNQINNTYTHRLYKILLGADTSGGARGTIIYTYDTAGRIILTIDPVGRQISYTYDNRDRLITVEYYTYPSHSTEKYYYGLDGTNSDNLLVKYKDQNGSTTKYLYDDSGRRVKTIYSYSTINDFGNEIINNDASTRNEDTFTYLSGTKLIKNQNHLGNLTEYIHDYRQRVKTTTIHPNAGTVLSSENKYVNNLLFSVSDFYGRYTYNVYRSSDASLIKTIRGLITGFSLIDFASTASLTRSLNENPDYIIDDYELNFIGQIVTHIDGRGNRFCREYNSRGQIIRDIAAEGTPSECMSEFDLDAQGNLIIIRHPRHFTEPGGFISEYIYSGRNLLTCSIDAKGRSEEISEYYSYYSDGRIKDTLDSRGHNWTTKWRICCPVIVGQVDPLSLVDDSDVEKRATDISGTDYANNPTYTATVKDLPVNLTQSWWRNPTESDTLNETTTKFDLRNRKIAKTIWLEPLTTSNAWVNPPIAGDNGIDSSKGLTTRWAYDDNLIDGIGLDTIYADILSSLGNNFFGDNSACSAIETTKPAGEKSLIVYDGIGRQVLKVDGNGNTVRFVYDNIVDGLVKTTVIDSVGNCTSSYTDSNGKTRIVIDADQKNSLKTYDANGNMLRARDFMNIGYDSTFDALNRETSRRETPDSGQGIALGDFIYQQRVFDSSSNLKQTKDGLGNLTEYSCDGLNRVTSRIDRLGGVTKYEYDAFNNLTSIEDADACYTGNHNKTLFNYDSRNLLICELFPDNGIRTYKYDADRRLTRRIDQNNDATSYAYDMASRLVMRSYPDNLNDIFTYDAASRLTTANSGRYNNSISRAYDVGGRLIIENQIINGIGRSVSYEYDKSDRLVSIIHPDGTIITQSYTNRDLLNYVLYNGSNIASFSYDDVGRLTNTSYANGITETRTYKPGDNHISSINVPGLVDFVYNYNSNKRKTSEYSINSINNQEFIYDNEDRLISWNRGVIEHQTWTLSFVCDWQYTKREGDSAYEQTRQHNSVHEITAINPVGGTPIYLNYDSRGNLTSDVNGQQYLWDYDNKMYEAKNADNAIIGNYAYDALGRRVNKSINGVNTRYIYNNAQVIDEYENEVLTKKYIYGAFIDKILVMINCNDAISNRYYYLSNSRFSPSVITDNSGAVIEKYIYDSYGNRTIMDSNNNILYVSSINQNRGFTGYQFDEEIGMYFARSRIYSAVLGTFISRDSFCSNPGWGFSGLLAGPKYGLTLSNYATSYDVFSEDDDIPDYEYAEKDIPYLPFGMETSSELFAGACYAEGLNMYWGLGMDQGLDPSGMQREPEWIGHGSAEGDEGGGEQAGGGKEHTKGARNSTYDKHTKPRPGRPTTKNRSNPNWRDIFKKRGGYISGPAAVQVLKAGGTAAAAIAIGAAIGSGVGYVIYTLQPEPDAGSRGRDDECCKGPDNFGVASVTAWSSKRAEQQAIDMARAACASKEGCTGCCKHSSGSCKYSYRYNSMNGYSSFFTWTAMLHYSCRCVCE